MESKNVMSFYPRFPQALENLEKHGKKNFDKWKSHGNCKNMQVMVKSRNLSDSIFVWVLGFPDKFKTKAVGGSKYIQRPKHKFLIFGENFSLLNFGKLVQRGSWAQRHPSVSPKGSSLLTPVCFALIG